MKYQYCSILVCVYMFVCVCLCVCLCGHYGNYHFLSNSNINEDKRKTEKQMLLFEVIKEIEDCPVS